MHDALVSARNLFVLHTHDYDKNYWTRKEFTNFLAAIGGSSGMRRICADELKAERAKPASARALRPTPTLRMLLRVNGIELDAGDALQASRDSVAIRGVRLDTQQVEEALRGGDLVSAERLFRGEALAGLELADRREYHAWWQQQRDQHHASCDDWPRQHYQHSPT